SVGPESISNWISCRGQRQLEPRRFFQGRSDIPLNETGRERARAVERRLANLSVSKVMVSPLKRAMETATLAFPNSSALIQVERDLIECDFGSLEGKHIKDAMNEYCITRKEQLAEILPTYGELWSAVLKRYKALLAKIAALQRFGPTVVLVGHDAVLQGI
ncbi:MAG: histidine phosphatase family protein, partial [Rhodobacterales bacterium]